MKIVFLGDSVTEGCFELLADGEGFRTLKDPENGYVSILRRRLTSRYPDLEIINAGIEGNATQDVLLRLERDVLSEKPDLTVVCLGLNDVWMRKPEAYADNLLKIFTALRNAGSRIIFMTPNMLNSYAASDVLPCLLDTAKDLASCQNEGVMDEHMRRGIETARKCGAEVCDAYGEWKRLAGYGIDTTALLANRLNHPTRKMHNLFADLLEPMLERFL